MLWTLIWLAIAALGFGAVAYVISQIVKARSGTRRGDLRAANQRAKVYKDALTKIANGDPDPRSVALTALVND